jgi:glycosyltransferase involved in cell wall biosynthesis
MPRVAEIRDGLRAPQAEANCALLSSIHSEDRSPAGAEPIAGSSARFQTGTGPLKVVHYLPRLCREDGGLFRAVIDLARGVAALGHKVTLLSWDDRDLEQEKPPSSGWTSVVIKPPFPRHHSSPLGVSALMQAARALRNADVVHLHGPWYPSNLQISMLADRMGVPYGVSLHGMLDDWSMTQKAYRKRIYHALVARRFLDHATWVHCSTQSERAQASQWFLGTRAAVLPNPVDLELFASLDGGARARQELGLAEGAPFTVLFLGRLHKKKGLELLLDATAVARAGGLLVDVLVAGTSEDPEYMRSLQRKVVELGLQGQVHFLGFVSGPTKTSLYQCADLVATPSWQENFGYVQVEALACGTPVVTSKIDFSEELESSGGAEIVERDPRSLAAAISSLCADDGRRREMGARGRSWAMETFGGNGACARFVSLYRGQRHA